MSYFSLQSFISLLKNQSSRLIFFLNLILSVFGITFNTPLFWGE